MAVIPTYELPLPFFLFLAVCGFIAVLYFVQFITQKSSNPLQSHGKAKSGGTVSTFVFGGEGGKGYVSSPTGKYENLENGKIGKLWLSNGIELTNVVLDGASADVRLLPDADAILGVRNVIFCRISADNIKMPWKKLTTPEAIDLVQRQIVKQELINEMGEAANLARKIKGIGAKAVKEEDDDDNK